MSENTPNVPDTSAAGLLAQKLEQDIRRRGLGPGERYLTAAEAARLLHVSRPGP